jgi:VanZ family protein
MNVGARRRAVAWLPVGLYMAVIWGLSSLGHPAVPVELFPFEDKGIHALEYGLLAVLVSHAVLRTWPSRGPLRLGAVAVLITVGWGVMDEIHQAFVPGRSADILDLAADAAGAAAGTVARVMFHLRRVRRVLPPTSTP